MRTLTTLCGCAGSCLTLVPTAPRPTVSTKDPVRRRWRAAASAMDIDRRHHRVPLIVPPK